MYDQAVDEALGVYAQAIGRGDPRVRHVYFDASIVGMSEKSTAQLIRRMREIGMDRILFGSDAPFPGNGPREYLERWHKLPLTPEEFRTIESNIAPYLKSAR